MKKKTKKQELVAKTHLLPLVILFLSEKRVKIYVNRKGTKFSISNNGLIF